MQEREFENLLSGKDAKWAPMNLTDDEYADLLTAKLNALDAPANIYNVNNIDSIQLGYPTSHPTPEQVKQQLIDHIKIHQVEIPNEVKERVRKFVKKLTDQGKAARFIRRAVMREFNIKVV